MKKLFIIFIFFLITSTSLFSSDDKAPNIDPGNIDPAKDRIVVAEVAYAFDIEPRIGFSSARVNSIVLPSTRYPENSEIAFQYDDSIKQYRLTVFTYVQTFGTSSALEYTLTVSDLATENNTHTIKPNVTVNNITLDKKTNTRISRIEKSELPTVTSDEIIMTISPDAINYALPYTGTIKMEVKATT